MKNEVTSRLNRAKLWIEQLDRVVHERPEEVLAVNVARQQAEIDALRDRVAALEENSKT
ncbi:MAG: hypothetical protein NXH87_08080 [Rhodobiaceae bacterium]|nr:hypothetical protein RHODOSMS8_01735 [Rhodobiaceae bacterium]MCR9241324.1 hypothetical protein [Rhodobiaceae bacterium]